MEKETLMNLLRKIVAELAEEGVPSELAATVVLVAAEKVYGRQMTDAQFLSLWGRLIDCKPTLQA